MNTIQGEIKSVTVHKNLTLVKVQAGSYTMSSIVIDTPDSATYLKEGESVNVIFKETEVILGVERNLQISLQNKFYGKVISIETGNLLGRVVIETELGPITSIVTANAVRQLGLAVGGTAVAMIKTNEVMLAEL